MLLALEDLEQREAGAAVEAEARSSAERAAATRNRRANRGALPSHLPRIETIVDVEDKACPCCRGKLHQIGEDVSEKLDVVPAQFRVRVVRRPKYACRACEDVVVQAPAPARLIEGGLPTEATVAHVLVAKYADHLPLYRQARIYERQGVRLDRSTLADWVGRAAFHLRPVHERILAHLRLSTKLFADETTAPVLDPGRGRTKTGQLWAYARRQALGRIGPAGSRLCLCARPQGVAADRPPCRLQGRSPGRRLCRLSRARRKGRREPRVLRVACETAVLRARRRRRLADRQRSAPAHRGALSKRSDIRGRRPEQRRDVRQARTRPLIADLEPWLREKLGLISQKSKLAEAIRYALARWEGLTRFLGDGRIEIDSNTVERSIRPIALNRKNALFAGSTRGLHTAHLVIPLYLKEIFLVIVRRRPSRPPSVGFAPNGLARQLGMGDYPGRAFARLARGQRSFGNQAAHS